MSGRSREYGFDEDGSPIVYWRTLRDEASYEPVLPYEGCDGEQLLAALESITPRQRFVLECSWGLRDGGPQSFREIGKLMGIQVSAVHGHYTRGMKALRKALGG